MPLIGSKKYPLSKKGKVLAEDLMPKGPLMLKDDKWIPIQEAKLYMNNYKKKLKYT